MADSARFCSSVPASGLRLYRSIYLTKREFTGKSKEQYRYLYLPGFALFFNVQPYCNFVSSFNFCLKALFKYGDIRTGNYNMSSLTSLNENLNTWTRPSTHVLNPSAEFYLKSDSKDSTLMSQEIISLGGFLLDQTLEICLVWKIIIEAC